MNITLIGKKIGMSQIYDDSGILIPITVIKLGPCPVIQVKTKANDGYDAVQVGFGKQKEHRITKPLQGHFAKANVDGVHQLNEFRTDGSDRQFEAGQVLDVTEFEAGQLIDIIGTTKGKGFQGVVKRWGFNGGPASHGSMVHRRGGSYGQCQWPGEIAKGKKMPGHTGDVRRTTQNIAVVKVIEDKNLLLVKGSVHGSKGGTVYVRVAKKTKKRS